MFFSLYIVVMSGTISVYKIYFVRLYHQLFVGGPMSYFRGLCLFAYSGVQHILWCVCVVLFFVLLLVCLDCPLIIVPSVFSNDYSRYLCLLAQNGAQHILCCIIAFLSLVSFSGLSVSQSCQFLSLVSFSGLSIFGWPFGVLYRLCILLFAQVSDYPLVFVQFLSIWWYRKSRWCIGQRAQPECSRSWVGSRTLSGKTKRLYNWYTLFLLWTKQSQCVHSGWFGIRKMFPSGSTWLHVGLVQIKNHHHGIER